jgi:hypothetical protein
MRKWGLSYFLKGATTPIVSSKNKAKPFFFSSSPPRAKADFINFWASW